MQLRLDERTKSEFDEALRYYATADDDDVGRAFRRHTQELLIGIAEHPFRWRLISKRVRRCLYPRRFPYVIHYQVCLDHVRVLSIKHTSRHPNAWKDSVTKK
jgi:plasmid stabilization system protein ParE